MGIWDGFFTKLAQRSKLGEIHNQDQRLILTQKLSRRILLTVEKNSRCQNSWPMWTVVLWAIQGHRVLGW